MTQNLPYASKFTQIDSIKIRIFLPVANRVRSDHSYVFAD